MTSSMYVKYVAKKLKLCLTLSLPHDYTSITVNDVFENLFNKKFCTWICSAILFIAHKLELPFLWGSHFYHVAGIFKKCVSSKVEARMNGAMALTFETVRSLESKQFSLALLEAISLTLRAVPTPMSPSRHQFSSDEESSAG